MLKFVNVPGHLPAKSITDAPSFRSWEGAQPAREALVSQFSGLLEQDQMDTAAAVDAATGGHANDLASAYVPPERLKSLLHMAVAYQVEFSKYHPRKAPRVRSLLHDYGMSPTKTFRGFHGLGSFHFY